MAEPIKPLVGRPEALRGALDETGWLGAPVRAAAVVRQGHSPSLVATAIGYGLISLLKPRPRRDLPRTLVLAATAERVVAYRARCVTHDEDDLYVTIWPDELASWPRGSVTVETAKQGMNENATLRIAGQAAIPVGESAEGTLAALSGELGSSPAATAR